MTIPNSVLDLFTEASKISYEHPKNLEEFESLNDDEIFTGYLYGMDRSHMTIESTMTRSATFGFLNAKYDLGELDRPLNLSIIKTQYMEKYKKKSN